MVKNLKCVFIWFMLIVLIGLACNVPSETTTQPTSSNLAQPEATTEGQANEPVEAAPTQPFLGATYEPHDASKIILMSVEPDAESNIQKISMFLPENLDAAEIYANGVKVEAVLGDGGVAMVNMADAASPDVELVFKSGEEQLASCTVHSADLLNPAGDCTW